MVAERDPEEIDVPQSDLEIVACASGLPSGKRSKWGPDLTAPAQWVVSTDITPSNSAAMSFSHQLNL